MQVGAALRGRERPYAGGSGPTRAGAALRGWERPYAGGSGPTRVGAALRGWERPYAGGSGPTRVGSGPTRVGAALRGWERPYAGWERPYAGGSGPTRVGAALRGWERRGIRGGGATAAGRGHGRRGRGHGRRGGATAAGEVKAGGSRFESEARRARGAPRRQADGGVPDPGSRARPVRARGRSGARTRPRTWRSSWRSPRRGWPGGVGSRPGPGRSASNRSLRPFSESRPRSACLSYAPCAQVAAHTAEHGAAAQRLLVVRPLRPILLLVAGAGLAAQRLLVARPLRPSRRVPVRGPEPELVGAHRVPQHHYWRLAVISHQTLRSRRARMSILAEHQKRSRLNSSRAI